jgi:hypothetical protein
MKPNVADVARSSHGIDRATRAELITVIVEEEGSSARVNQPVLVQSVINARAEYWAA